MPRLNTAGRTWIDWVGSEGAHGREEGECVAAQTRARWTTGVAWTPSTKRQAAARDVSKKREVSTLKKVAGGQPEQEEDAPDGKGQGRVSLEPDRPEDFDRYVPHEAVQEDGER